jgi:hypothetical protein
MFPTPVPKPLNAPRLDFVVIPDLDATRSCGDATLEARAE